MFFSKKGNTKMDYSNYNNNRSEMLCSWPIILVALYFFFPAGIYLIIKKSRLHRRNTFTIGRNTFSSAICLFVVGAIFYLPKMMLALTNNFYKGIDTTDIEAIINSAFYSKALGYGNLIIMLGIIVLVLSFYQKHKAKQYQNYIGLIVNKGIEDLDEISKRMNLHKSKVIKDISVLMKRRYLPEHYDLDIEKNRIYDIPTEKRKREEKERNSRIVQCPNCKANNLLVERIGKCEYCKSYIE